MKRFAIMLVCSALSVASFAGFGCDEKKADAPPATNKDQKGDKDKDKSADKDKDKSKDKSGDDTDKAMAPPSASDSTNTASSAAAGDDDSDPAVAAAASTPVPSDYAEAAQQTIQTADDYKKRLDELDNEIGK